MSTFNVVDTFGSRAVPNVVSKLWDVGESARFDASYLVPDSYGQKFLYPGMIVAYKNTNKNEYVPYSPTASYGPLSSYPVGVNYMLYDCSFRSPIIAPATRAALIEALCFVFGGAVGQISTAVKDALKLIQWD